jgi:hypothetical protein
MSSSKRRRYSGSGGDNDDDDDKVEVERQLAMRHRQRRRRSFSLLWVAIVSTTIWQLCQPGGGMVATTNAWVMIRQVHINRYIKIGFLPSNNLDGLTSSSSSSRRESNQLLQAASNSDEEKETDDVGTESSSITTESKESTLSDLNEEVDEFQAQQDAADKVMNRIMLPRRIGSAISSTVTAFAYAFLIATFALNLLGYDWVNDGSLRIGTLEEKAFRNEIVKMKRQEQQEIQQKQEQQQKTRAGTATRQPMK